MYKTLIVAAVFGMFLNFASAEVIYNPELESQVVDPYLECKKSLDSKKALLFTLRYPHVEYVNVVSESSLEVKNTGFVYSFAMRVIQGGALTMQTVEFPVANAHLGKECRAYTLPDRADPNY